jgi:hypothetical protein
MCWKLTLDAAVLRKCAGNLPLMRQSKALNTDSDLQLARTPISPEEFSGKEVSTDWFAKEGSGKLTSDAGVAAVELRDVRAVLKNLDVA